MSWYEIAKDAIKAAQKADNASLVNQLIDLQSEMIDMQNTISKLRDHNQLLSEQLEIKNKMQYDHEMNYYMEVSVNGNQEGPFCPRCWDRDRKQARLAKNDLDLKCNVCGLEVGKENNNKQLQELEQLQNNFGW